MSGNRWDVLQWGVAIAGSVGVNGLFYWAGWHGRRGLWGRWIALAVAAVLLFGDTVYWVVNLH